jgi:3-phosphoshikimate 1-carboxyvinyltransferase
MTAMASERVRAVRLKPRSVPFEAIVEAPGSKSITNRALIVAALARGESTLRGALESDDTLYMAESLRRLGLEVEHDPTGHAFRVVGGNGTFTAESAELFVGNSGTSMRFLVAALPLGQGTYRIDGVERMRKRPLSPLLAALNELGADVESELGTGGPPVVVRANGLPGGTIQMTGDQTSQYFSALLMAAPYARDGVTIEVIGDLVSKPYMPMTTRVMADFGVIAELDEVNWKTMRVAPGQAYTGRDYLIEPDASGASYFFAAAAVTGSKVTIPGLGTESTQGDLDFVRALERMGATVEMSAVSTTVTGPKDGALRGVTIDMNAISDTAQTLAAIAPFADGPTTITGVGHARLKETDRVAALANELRKMGQEIDEFPDGLTIVPRPVRAAEIETYDDHRMAMSFGVAALRAPEISILDPACTAKTFPDFFERLSIATGAEVIEEF